MKLEDKETIIEKHPLLISKGYKPRRGSVKLCICNKQFYVRPCHIRIKNYCSKACASKALIKGSPLICRVCANSYYQPPSQVKWRGSSFCSRKCMGINRGREQVGENNPSWKGGVSTENHRVRQSKPFKDWRKSVFERDNYTCQDCGVRGGYLEPHHIKQFAVFPELRFDINNGKTLCIDCHKKTPSWGRKNVYV